MRKIVISGALLLGLAGCGPVTVSPVTSLPPAKTVVFVASVPKEFRVATTGLTVFQNNLDVIDDSSWGLNELAYKTAFNILTPGFQVTEATPDTEIDDTGDVGTDVRQQVHVAQAPDLYVLLCTGDAPALPFQYPDILQNVGFSESIGIFKKLDPVVHTYLELAVVDGKTFKTLYDTPLLMDPNRPIPKDAAMFDVGGGPSYPVETLDNFSWTDDWASMTPVQQRLVQDKTSDLLSASVAYTLTKMNMLKQ